ncbi:hypothetical protein HY990_01640 [Candidatus Micrarchaeota archaeon]|nr:hypothetical protein [Candidatus Micrarchaeota archaeon]
MSNGPGGVAANFSEESVSIPLGSTYMVSVNKKGRFRKSFDSKRFEEIVRLYFLEKLSVRKIASLTGLSHMTVYRMLSDPNVAILV